MVALAVRAAIADEYADRKIRSRKDWFRSGNIWYLFLWLLTVDKSNQRRWWWRYKYADTYTTHTDTQNRRTYPTTRCGSKWVYSVKRDSISINFGKVCLCELRCIECVLMWPTRDSDSLFVFVVNVMRRGRLTTTITRTLRLQSDIDA